MSKLLKKCGNLSPCFSNDQDDNRIAAPTANATPRALVSVTDSPRRSAARMNVTTKPILPRGATRVASPAPKPVRKNTMPIQMNKALSGAKLSTSPEIFSPPSRAKATTIANTANTMDSIAK